MANTRSSPSVAAEVFVSYSTEDRDKIEPIVDLVRAMKDGSVFQDFLSIRPGERWESEIMEALKRCRTVLVFWCEHSAASEWVRQEYEAGIAADKEVIPILLDDMEVPEPLRAYQWLDFRRAEPHGGLSRFVPGVFIRSGSHYYPKDEYGDYHDWESEQFYEEEYERHKKWKEAQAKRHDEFAHEIAARLDSAAQPSLQSGSAF